MNSLRITGSAIALAIAVWGASSAPAMANDPYSARVVEAHSVTTTVFLEGGYAFVAGDRTFSFDPESDKLGDLSPLRNGDSGVDARFAVQHQLQNDWDLRVGGGLLVLRDDETSVDDDFASQKLRIATLDAEVGYTYPLSAPSELRVFAGARAIGSKNTAMFETQGFNPITEESFDKIGTYTDQAWAIGPRVGAELTYPVGHAGGFSIVAGASTAILFGRQDSGFTSKGSSSPLGDGRESITVWNNEFMAGIAMPVAEGASLTMGYRGQHWRGLAIDRVDVVDSGSFDRGGSADLIAHGPFMRLTLALPPR